jgi:hypothetical protein
VLKEGKGIETLKTNVDKFSDFGIHVIGHGSWFSNYELDVPSFVRIIIRT